MGTGKCEPALQPHFANEEDKNDGLQEEGVGIRYMHNTEYPGRIHGLCELCRFVRLLTS